VVVKFVFRAARRISLTHQKASGAVTDERTTSLLYIHSQQQRPRGFVPLFRPSPVLGWSGRYYCYFASVLPWRAVDALSLRVERCDLQPGSCFHGGTVFL
jgi:hypothetical protein